jgi:hypothetical protein
MNCPECLNHYRNKNKVDSNHYSCCGNNYHYNNEELIVATFKFERDGQRYSGANVLNKGVFLIRGDDPSSMEIDTLMPVYPASGFLEMNEAIDVAIRMRNAAEPAEDNGVMFPDYEA